MQEVTQDLNPIDSAAFPPERYIKHRRAMLLVDEVLNVTLEAEHQRIITRSTLNSSCVFFEKELTAIPAWAGLEFLAQSAAILVGIDDEQKGLRIQLGFLLGSRNYESHCQGFNINSTITVDVSTDYQDGDIRVFSGCILDEQGNVLAEGSLTAFRPEDEDTYLQDEAQSKNSQNA